MPDRTFPGLETATKRAAKAVDVLNSAIDALHPPRNGESLSDLATRLRGASILVHSAGLELATVAGWNEAAHVAAEAGVLDGSDDDG